MRPLQSSSTPLHVSSSAGGALHEVKPPSAWQIWLPGQVPKALAPPAARLLQAERLGHAVAGLSLGARTASPPLGQRPAARRGAGKPRSVQSRPQKRPPSRARHWSAPEAPQSSVGHAGLAQEGLGHGAQRDARASVWALGSIRPLHPYDDGQPASAASHAWVQKAPKGPPKQKADSHSAPAVAWLAEALAAAPAVGELEHPALLVHAPELLGTVGVEDTLLHPRKDDGSPA